uniref:Uncharacterized protein n=1 Tax=Panagrolaimus sp. PS1159 TaxID=55785 RepID=A0AC35GRZ6_9BILA
MVIQKLSKIYDNFALKLLSQHEISVYDRALIVGCYGDIIVGAFFILTIFFNPWIIRSSFEMFKFGSIFAFFLAIIDFAVEYLQAKFFGLCSPKPIHVFVYPSKKLRQTFEPFKLEFMNPKLSDGFKVLYNLD